MDDDTQSAKLSSTKPRRKSEGKETRSLGNKKRGVGRSKSSVLTKSKSMKGKTKVSRSRSADDDEIFVMSKATESPPSSPPKRGVGRSKSSVLTKSKSMKGKTKLSRSKSGDDDETIVMSKATESPPSSPPKRGVGRSKSSALTKSKSMKGKRKLNRSKSAADDEIFVMSQATESPPPSQPKRERPLVRKVKKSASGSSKSRKKSDSVSRRRTSTASGNSKSRKRASPTRTAKEPRNSVSPRRRREESRSNSPYEGRPIIPNRGSSSAKMNSWVDVSSRDIDSTKPVHHGGGGDYRDRTPSPPPAPPPPRHPASARPSRDMRKQHDSNMPQTAVVTRRKKGRNTPTAAYESAFAAYLKSVGQDELLGNDHDYDATLEVSKGSLVAAEDSHNSVVSSPLSRTSKSAPGDNHSKSSPKKLKKKKNKSEAIFPNYTNLLDSPSTSSMTSTVSGESLKDRLKDEDGKESSLGELFDMARAGSDATDGSDSDSDTAASVQQEVKWIELAQDNPADVVIKVLHEQNNDDNDDDEIKTFIVPADTRMMNTLAEDFARNSFKSIVDGTTKKKSPAKNPSLGATIGRDRRSVQNRAPDDRTNCTLATAGSEQTQKATNKNQDNHSRISDTVHETGFVELNDKEDPNDKLENTSEDSQSSLVSSIQSTKSLPVRRGGKGNKESSNQLKSSSGYSQDQKRQLRRSKSQRQHTSRSRDAPRRTRSGRSALRRTASSHTGNKSSSEIDDFMAMTKSDDMLTSTPNKESTDGTMSTATESTMTTDTTIRSSRQTVGNTLNPTLIQNFHLTF